MGTRGEVYVRNSSSVIELWRHYDTYADYMVPYFKGFARYAAWCAGSQRHWLTYPENVAAMLIAYDHELAIASHLRFARTGLCEATPDLRPRGCISDFEKVWILDILDVNQTDDIVWLVRGFNFKHGADVEEMRESIRKGKDAVLGAYLEKVVELRIRPRNGKGGCRLCGYPGPLIVVEDPPFCIYCLLKNAMRDDFFKAEVQRLVKVAPLITQISR
jgi:hypothetical protein